MSKKLILTGPRKIEFQDCKERALKSDEVRLKTIMSGISHGTEMNLYRGTAPFFKKNFDSEYRIFIENETALNKIYPTQIGYESVCEVMEVGKKVKSLKKGDICHVYLPHAETHIIKERLIKEIVTILPSEIKPEEGTMIALASVALIGIHDAGIKIGNEVAIFGLGTIGLILVQLAKLEGATKIIGIDPIEKRRVLAQKLGATAVINPLKTDVALEIKKNISNRKGVDVALESSGTYEGLHEAIRCVCMAGKVVTLGYYQGGGNTLYLGEEWHHNRITMLSSMGVWGCPHRNYPLWNLKRIRETILHLLKEKKLNLKALITHKIPFKEARKAYELIDKHPERVIKVVLVY